MAPRFCRENVFGRRIIHMAVQTPELYCRDALRHHSWQPFGEMHVGGAATQRRITHMAVQSLELCCRELCAAIRGSSLGDAIVLAGLSPLLHYTH